MALIKGGSSHQIGSKLPVWQRGFTDHRVRDGNEFEMRRQYIHENLCEQGWWNALPCIPIRQPIDPTKEKRTSAAEAVSRAELYGTGEPVPFVQRILSAQRRFRVPTTQSSTKGQSELQPNSYFPALDADFNGVV
jgi:hypothetical protein